MALLAALLVLAAGCRDSNAPDPESFGPLDENQVDPRTMTFHNGSVEMAHLEIFAPAAKIKDCQAEAPHRLLCPTDYKHLLAKKVYPRTKIEAKYPKGLPLECAQVWVRVHTKAMQPDENREAIFLLPGEGKSLVLELGEGEAARLDHKGFGGARYRFPAPVRYCDPALPEHQDPPKETIRSEAEVTRAVAGVKTELHTCCKFDECVGTLRASLRLRRDGTVLGSETVGGRKPSEKAKKLQECLLQALARARFSGFTAAQTTAEVTLRLPVK